VTQYPEEYVNQVSMTDMGLRPNEASGNPGRTYQWFDDATVPFGHGLHYTDFSVSVEDAGNSSWAINDLLGGCDEEYKDLCPFQSIAVDIENTGDVTSDFVTLGFISGEYGLEPYPIKQLVAYERSFGITPGLTTTAHLNLTVGSLGRHDEAGNLVLYPGAYSLLVDVPTRVTWNFTLTGEETVLEEWPQDPGENGAGKSEL
jgi:beta-D-xylosidase 4